MEQYYTDKSGIMYAPEYLCIGQDVYPAIYNRDAETNAVSIRTEAQTADGNKAVTITYHADHQDYDAASAAETLANCDGMSIDDLLVDVLTEPASHADATATEPEPSAPAKPEKPLPDWAGETIQGNGFRVRFDAFWHRTCVEFDDMPCKQARELCLAAGFSWSPSKGL